MRIRRLILGLLAVFLLLLLVVAFPFVYDPNLLKRLLIEQVEQQLGHRVEVGVTSVQLFPRIRIQAADVVVRHRQSGELLFRADRLDLVLRAFSLLRHQVIGKRLRLEHPELYVHRDRLGRWSTQGEGPPTRPAWSNPLTLLTLTRTATITQGELTVVDDFRPDGARTVRVTHIDMTTAVDPDSLQALVYLAARVPSERGEADLKLGGTLMQTEGPVRLDPHDSTSSMPGVQFQGRADLDRLDVRQVAEVFLSQSAAEGLDGTASLHGQLSLVPGVVGYDMVLSNMMAQMAPLTIHGQASVSGLMAPQLAFAMSFSSSPATLTELLKRAPGQWLHPRLQKLVTEYQLTGTIEAVSATVLGSAAPEPYLSLVGEFKVSHGHMVVRRHRTVASNVSGTVFVEPGRLRALDLAGQYGPLRVTGGKALVSLLDSGPVLDLKVTGEIGAADVVTVLATSIRSKPVAGAFRSVRDVVGETSVALQLSGPIGDPRGVTVTRAEIVPHSVSLLSPQWLERVADLNGTVVFTKAGVEFEHLTGRVGGSQTEVQGFLSTTESPAYHDLTVRTQAEARQLLRMASLSLPAELTVHGMTGLAVVLSGPLSAPRIRGALELRETNLRLSSYLSKPAGAATALEFDGTLARDVLSIDRVDVILPPFRVTGKGRMRLQGHDSFEGTIVSGPISIAGLPPGISVSPIQDGILEISLDVKGMVADWKTWQLSGWVALTDGLIVPKHGEEPIRDVYLRMKLIRHGAELKRLAFKIKDSDIRATGALRDWHRTPAVSLRIESSQFDFDLIVPKASGSLARGLLETVAAGSHVDASVSIDRGYYRRFALADLSGQLTIGDSLLTVNRVSGDTEDGHVAGRLSVHLPAAQPADGDVTVRITGVPLDRLTASLVQERLLTGRLSLAGSLHAAEGVPGGFVSSLRTSEPLTLLLKDGRIHKLTLLTKILTILNLPAFLQGKVDLTEDGMPFDAMTGHMSVAAGFVTIEKLFVDSPVMKMSGAGRYDMTADHLDMAIATSPFGSYAQLLKSIPLFGKLLRGERQGIDTALFEVKGSLRDPQVNYLPMKSLARGLSGLAELAYDILRNAVLLPRDMMLPKQSASGVDGSARGESAHPIVVP